MLFVSLNVHPCYATFDGNYQITCPIIYKTDGEIGCTDVRHQFEKKNPEVVPLVMIEGGTSHVELVTRKII